MASFDGDRLDCMHMAVSLYGACSSSTIRNTCFRFLRRAEKTLAQLSCPAAPAQYSLGMAASARRKVCALVLLVVQAASSLSNIPKFSIKSGERFAEGCSGAEAGGGGGGGGGGGEGTLSLLLFQEPASASGASATAYGISQGAWSTAAWHNLGAREPPIKLILRGGGEGMEEDDQEEETEVSRLVSEGWSLCGEGDPLEAERLFHAALRKVVDPAVSPNSPQLHHSPLFAVAIRAMME